MTVPTDPEDSTFGLGSLPMLAGSIRLVALALPLTLLVLFLGVIWLIGIVIPPAHSNSQKTGRQALAMIRAIAPK